MITYYGSKISDNIIKSPEGYLICLNVPIARTGDQEYYANEIGLESSHMFNGNEPVITIHRKPEEVFSKATLASFEGKPFTDEHPMEDVSATNYQMYAKGHIQNVRQGEGVDSDKILADIYVNDPNTINEIQNGKREISCGYLCSYQDNEDGTFNQVNIRGNHISLVEEGRAGSSVCIKDSKPKTNNIFSERRKFKMADKKSNALKSFLNVFARSVRDAKSVDEVDEMVENAEETVKNLPDTTKEKEVVAEVKTNDNPNGMIKPTSEVDNSLLSAILALTEAIKTMKTTPIAVPEEQKKTPPIEDSESKELPPASKGHVEVEEDDSMNELEKVLEKDEDTIDQDKSVPVDEEVEVKDECQVHKNDNETRELAKFSMVEKGKAPEGAKESFADIKAKDEDSVEEKDVDEVAEEEDIETLDEEVCTDFGNEDSATKIVKDMKPVLSKIKDYKTRKLVCDSLARTLRKNSGSNSMKGILDSQSSFTKDSASRNYLEVQQSVYDNLNPHIKH